MGGAEKRKKMKLISWNVNGLRACIKKGFLDFCRENCIITDYDKDEIKVLFDNQTEKEDEDDE